MVDEVHIDGDISGDVQGDFGVVRGIELTGTQANATGIEFPVNVIHEESWFNLTGINGGNFFDGAGIGATHNQTWDYQVIYSNWENRTVRLVWEETGADASSGEEYPERSPIERTAEPPEYEEALGNLTISRDWFDADTNASRRHNKTRWTRRSYFGCYRRNLSKRPKRRP